MSSISKLSRFDQSQLQLVYISGSVNYTIGEFNLFSVDVNSTDPSNALVSIPVQMETYLESDARNIYDFKFSTFVDLEPETTTNSATENIINLENTISDLQGDNEISDAERKNLIVTLRIQLNQGTTAADFESEFPYAPIITEIE